MAASTLIDKFWKAALGIGGVAAIGAFVFYGLYKNWLTLDIFAKLTSNQTFIIMIVFLVFVFLIAFGMLVAWFFDRSRMNIIPTKDSISFSVPANCSFEQALRALASENSSVVEFIGFSDETLSTTLKSQSITATSTHRAMELLRNLGDTSIPSYRVENKDGKYIVSKS